MAENEVKVGASVDLAQFKAGMAELVEVTQASMEAVNAALASVSGGLTELGSALNLSALTEFMEHTKEQVLELGHLSETTHISVVHISELKDAMEEMGVSTNRLPAQLTSLERSMGEAAQGGNRQADAFRELGISTAGWAANLPDAMGVMEQLAAHLEHSHSRTRDLANMNAIFGGSVEGLTAFLKANGDQLDAVTRKHLEHGIELEKSIDAAKKLNQAEAQLKSELETQLLPVFRLLVDAIDGLKIMYAVLSEEITFFGARALTVGQGVVDAFSGIGRILKAVFTGHFKDVAGEVHNTLLAIKLDYDTFNQTYVDQERETNAKIAEILKPKPQVPVEDETNQEQTKLQRSIQIAIAKIEAKKKAQEAEIALEKEHIDAMAKQHKISAEEELKLNQDLIDKKFRQDIAAAEAKRAQLARDSQRNQTQIIALNGQIQALHTQQRTELAKVDDKYLEDKQKAEDKAAAEAEKKLLAYHERELTEAEKHINEQARIDKLGFDNEIKEIEDNASRGLISKEQERADLTRIYTAEVTDLKTKLQAEMDLEESYRNWLKTQGKGEDDKEYQASLSRTETLQNSVNRATEQFAADLEKVRTKTQQTALSVQDYIKKMQVSTAQLWIDFKSHWQQALQEFNQGFTQGVNQWIETGKGFGQAMAQTFVKILEGFVDMLVQMALQWVETKIMMALFGKTTDNSSAAASIASNAAVAYSGAYASTTVIPIVGPELAPEVAMGAYLDVMAMQAANFHQGGLVPMTGLAVLERGEKVIPRSMSGDGSGLGGGGNTVHVHMNVQTMDSASFKDTVGRHGHLIGDMVNKALKKKGIK